MRLKLQTPLFVADALMTAAGSRLSAELAAARVRGSEARYLSGCHPFLCMMHTIDECHP